MPKKRAGWRKEHRLVGGVILSETPHADTKEAAERRQWLHRQPCLWGRLIADPCSPGGVDECHVNEDKGIGLKSKHPTFPCCRKHHEIADGQARHQTVIPLEQMKMRALLMLMSWWTERDWQDVVTHEQRRESL